MQGNARELNFVTTICKSTSWDVIVDFMVYRIDTFTERIEMLLSSCKQYIFLSSSRVYANSVSPITEDYARLLDVCTDKKFLNSHDYALDKAREEDVLKRSQKANWTIIRPYITYSSGRLQLGVNEKETWLHRALKGRSIVFSKDIAERITTLTYGYDVARGINALIGKKEALGEVFHIMGDQTIKWKDALDIYLDVLEEKLGKRPRVCMYDKSLSLYFSAEASYQVVYDRHYDRVFCNEKIRRFIDTSSFIPPTVGLKKCLEEFLNKPSFHGSCGYWLYDAYCDRISKERTPLKEIPSIKRKVMYLLCRYIIPISLLKHR